MPTNLIRCHHLLSPMGFFLLILTVSFSNVPASSVAAEESATANFKLLISGSNADSRGALNNLRLSWQNSYVAPLIEILSLGGRSARTEELVNLLEEKTGHSYGYDIQGWFKWLWSEPIEAVDGYAQFKGWLYGKIDSRFTGYFSDDYATTIRLDEVRWGGVLQDGIPPLRNPEMITVQQASYLEDDNIVFAIEINGDYRAYPKRIMAWHEMFVDEVGDLDIVGVYCTLCGSMIIYETEFDGVVHQMGTSGFLFRSNKLMYDRDTQSLWNTIWGRPVIGPLVGKGIKLARGSVVTTSWGEWRRRHPDTSVLSLNTGYDRDYGEGVAYRDYFSTDELMFNVPELDGRLKNKAQVLGIVLAQYPDQPLAISVDYLFKNSLYHEQIGEQSMLIVTDESGASRVYDAGGIEFVEWDRDRILVDENNVQWILAESNLLNSQGGELKRLPAHRAFWFGWYAAYTHTRLVF